MKSKTVVTVAFFSALLSALSLVVYSQSATATATARFVIDSHKDLSAGELKGTSVESSGQVTVGAEVSRVEIDEAVAYSAARGSDGAVYIGTGNSGKVYVQRGATVKELFDTKQLVVSSLTVAGNTVYAGTLPEGRIYKFASGKMSELARPEKAEHVWDLVWDPKKKRLIAATGPEGKVFSISGSGGVSELYDSEAPHIMSLALDGANLYAGTSGEALLLSIKGPGNASVVYDFPGNEITDIDVYEGSIAVLANEFGKPAGSRPSRTRGSKQAAPRAGKGRLWRVGADGRVDKIAAHDDRHYTCVQIAKNGDIYMGSAKDGHVYRVTGRDELATWVDVDERQVLAISLGKDRDLSGDPMFVTGDTAALYKVKEGKPENAYWTSKVQDAKFRARWGALTWRGEGGISFQSRSGETNKPDETWTDWSAAMTSSGPVRSKAARFIQVRAKLTSADSTLYAVELYYLPQNQRALVNNVVVKAAKPVPGAKAKASSIYPLSWKVSNPDKDALRYRLRFRQENQTVWRSILREDEELKKTTYKWETNGIPDGFYIVEVAASDEPANPEDRTLTSVGLSEPIRIDNHPPRIEGLAYKGGKVTGTAIDTLGPIQQLEVAVDGGSWRLFFPEDQILDTARERFAHPLSLEKGSHIVAIRATDAGGNVVTEEVSVQGK